MKVKVISNKWSGWYYSSSFCTFWILPVLSCLTCIITVLRSGIDQSHPDFTHPASFFSYPENAFSIIKGFDIPLTTLKFELLFLLILEELGWSRKSAFAVQWHQVGSPWSCPYVCMDKHFIVGHGFSREHEYLRG